MIMRKIKRIGFLVLIVIAIVFMFENRQNWEVKILFLGQYSMPAFSMALLLLGLGLLIGFLTCVWLRKRREAKKAA